MNFFVEIEFADDTMYYEKYDYRHEMAQASATPCCHTARGTMPLRCAVAHFVFVSQILDYFWRQPDYKAAKVHYARQTGKFVRFVNMLINDSIFTMDEARHPRLTTTYSKLTLGIERYNF